jgi:hypothetical protein
MAWPVLALVPITLGAAIVNGALGYGFSSITVPLALLFLSNRTLNPALVLIEIAVNTYVLWLHRDAVPAVWRRMAPIVIGLVPGAVIGTMFVKALDPSPLRLGTYLLLLPLILLQTAGVRRPFRAERRVGLLFGGGIGVLYAMTTISGPPLAVLLNNQGLAKREFRAALSVVRLAESTVTAIAYAWAGLYATSSLALIPAILPGIALGVPIGARLVRHVRAETFRRVCMSFDAWVVAFGVSTVLRQSSRLAVAGVLVYAVPAAVALIDGWCLYRFFALDGGGPRRDAVGVPPTRRLHNAMSGTPLPQGEVRCDPIAR